MITVVMKVSLTCRFILSEEQKRLFEKLSLYCDRYAEQIPVTFVLGTFIPGQLELHRSVIFSYWFYSGRCKVLALLVLEHIKGPFKPKIFSK